jgi:hypothetical protein
MIGVLTQVNEEPIGHWECLIRNAKLIPRCRKKNYVHFVYHFDSKLNIRKSKILE